MNVFVPIETLAVRDLTLGFCPAAIMTVPLPDPGPGSTMETHEAEQETDHVVAASAETSTDTTPAS